MCGRNIRLAMPSHAGDVLSTCPQFQFSLHFANLTNDYNELSEADQEQLTVGSIWANNCWSIWMMGNQQSEVEFETVQLLAVYSRVWIYALFCVVNYSESFIAKSHFLLQQQVLASYFKTYFLLILWSVSLALSCLNLILAPVMLNNQPCIQCSCHCWDCEKMSVKKVWEHKNISYES